MRTINAQCFQTLSRKKPKRRWQFSFYLLPFYLPCMEVLRFLVRRRGAGEERNRQARTNYPLYQNKNCDAPLFVLVTDLASDLFVVCCLLFLVAECTVCVFPVERQIYGRFSLLS